MSPFGSPGPPLNPVEWNALNDPSAPDIPMDAATIATAGEQLRRAADALKRHIRVDGDSMALPVGRLLAAADDLDQTAAASSTSMVDMGAGPLVGDVEGLRAGAYALRISAGLTKAPIPQLAIDLERSANTLTAAVPAEVWRQHPYLLEASQEIEEEFRAAFEKWKR